MEGKGSPTQTGGASYPTHQKNSTWDAFMWSSKLQLPSLADPLSPGVSGGASSVPTHRRGASMPPQLDEVDDASGLPPIRYDDLVGNRPRLGHRARGTINSFDADSDWTGSSTGGDRRGSGSDLGLGKGLSKDDMLIAEPPPTHRRGGSIPMTASTLGGLDLDGLLSTSSFASANQTSARPQHRRSVTFQGTTSSHSSDMFDFDSLKQGLDNVPKQSSASQQVNAVSTPPRISTPPPPSSASMPHQSHILSSAMPSMASPQMINSQPMMATGMGMPQIMAPSPLGHFSPAGPTMFAPPQGMFPGHEHMGGYHHQDFTDSRGMHHHLPQNAGGQMDPTMQMQLQMQQALLMQQQQWILAMQMQQQQQHQQQHQGGRGGRQPNVSSPMFIPQANVGPHSPSPPLMSGSPPQNGGTSSPMMMRYTKSSNNSGGGGHHHHHNGGPGTSPSNGPTSMGGGANASSSSDPVLSEYKATGLRPRIEDLKGHVTAFALDAHGSRFLQYQMEIAKAEDKDMLVQESLSSAVQLMQDTFGNYVVQNFLEHATTGSRRLLADAMKGYMLQLSIQPHGCRVVQRALDLVDVDQRNELLHELLVPKGNVFQAARNTHATHVLQKTVSILRRDSAAEANGNDRLRGSIDLMRAMEKAVADDVVPLLLHPHAYRLVLNVLGDCDVSRSIHIDRAVQIIADNRDQLCVDQHGNFMLQHMLDNKQADGVLDFVQERLVELSQHKFGSHLVEKCFAVASAERCAQLVEELLRPTSERNISATKKLKAQQGEGQDWGAEASPALALMKDPYANFVVQKAFDRVNQGPLKNELTSLVQDHAELLQKFTYGRHILAHVMATRGGGGQPTSNVSGGQQHQQYNGASSPSRNGGGSSPYGPGPRGFYPKNGGGGGPRGQVRG